MVRSSPVEGSRSRRQVTIQHEGEAVAAKRLETFSLRGVRRWDLGTFGGVSEHGMERGQGAREGVWTTLRPPLFREMFSQNGTAEEGGNQQSDTTTCAFDTGLRENVYPRDVCTDTFYRSVGSGEKSDDWCGER
ncbi:hypothetical protein Tco_0365107 [Tanacetum coccineum]